MTEDPRVFRTRLTVSELTQVKNQTGVSISVCLPALNEERTIGAICTTIRSLMPALVDELLVVDSGSDDDTMEVAAKAGADVHAVSSILPHFEVDRGGKGEVLWRSLAVARGDIVLWLDSDTTNFDPGFVLGLIEPLLVHPELRMTKAFYDRPLQGSDGSLTTGGARVTELLVRPLAHALFPELLGFIQPLSGEYAAHRDLLRSLPFFTGYGVEIGLLIDVAQEVGLDRVAQVDLGSRIHRNQEILALGRMAFQVAQTMTTRAEQLGRLKLANDWPESMRQFRSEGAGPVSEEHPMQVRELPPMKSVSGSDPATTP